MRERALRLLDPGVRWLTVATLTVVGIVPIVGDELRVQNVDPQFMRDIIERVHRFGGTFYQNGIYNKGPLEPVVYDLARHIGGYNGMWLVVSAFAAIAALAAAVAAAVMFAAAPVWYALRGSFAAYWTSWYGHAHLMSVGTRRSLASQFALGWNRAYAYYQHRPLVFLAIVAFVVFTYATWPSRDRRERIIHLALLGWLAGSWLEQVLNQRYSSHYFVINAVPTALMIA